jgi:hypothetical protein
MKVFCLFLILFGTTTILPGQPLRKDTLSEISPVSGEELLYKPVVLRSEKRLNFYVITKEKRKKIDYTTLTVFIRAYIRAFFDRKKMYIIVAKSSGDAARQIAGIVQCKGMLIDNIWFDSHGHYKNRHSSFRIGKDIFTYKNINDTGYTKYLDYISRYCDSKTKIALGACYAGADFYFPATDSTPACRMNGDSLMMGLGNIFRGSNIYASESWVMAKPGIFANKYGFAGYPLTKRSLDIIFKPVWERIGKWRSYNSSTGTLQNIGTVSMSRAGNINVLMKDYNQMCKTRKVIAKKLNKLQPGLAAINK